MKCLSVSFFGFERLKISTTHYSLLFTACVDACALLLMHEAPPLTIYFFSIHSLFWCLCVNNILSVYGIGSLVCKFCPIRRRVGSGDSLRGWGTRPSKVSHTPPPLCPHVSPSVLPHRQTPGSLVIWKRKRGRGKAFS